MSSSSWVKGKSPGWAAFNRRQQNKGIQTENDTELFPPIATTLSSLPPRENSRRVNGRSGRSFSSVLIPSSEFLTSAENFDEKKTIPSDFSVRGGKKVIEETSDVLDFRKLKELHSWADISLIEDVMEAVNYNIDEASTLLNAMVSNDSIENLSKNDSFEKNNKMNVLGLHFSNDLSCNGKNDISLSLEKTDDVPVLRSTIKDVNNKNNINNVGEDDTKLSECSYCERDFFHKVGNAELGLDCLKFVPIEPEWEEDDIYLSHRKEAIAMMRSASQHSRAATNAYLRNDHASAQHHSLRSQEQWLAAKMLNEKAAYEILQTRNSKTGLWKLDLHGLHAAEAVQALQEHLQKIEIQDVSNRSLSPRKAERKGIRRVSSLESLSCMDMKLDKEPLSCRRRPTSLEVITGIGNHSRGEAALPIAVTSFLCDNGYRFEQLRPGVISVRPKFHR